MEGISGTISCGEGHFTERSFQNFLHLQAQERRIYLAPEMCCAVVPTQLNAADHRSPTNALET